MLYKEKLEPALRADLFQNPPSNYRGTPFWAWNCELKTETLVEQIGMMKKMGLGGFHMHVRTGMSSSYLTDEFMGHIRTCVEKAREENMLAWLYDEDRWPSGAAGGIVTKDLQYAARSLLFTPTPYAADGFEADAVPMDASESERVRQENGVFLAAYDVLLHEDGTLRSYRRIGKEESAEGVKWYAYREISPASPWFNNQRYLCTLDPKATDRFLEVTHERYKEVVGEDFGGLIPAIFTDEPQFPPKQTLDFPAERKDVFMPWVDDLPETYRAVYGEDLLDSLPELFWELPEGKVSQARYRFHDYVTELFASNFCDRVGDWCSKNNLYLGGHLMEEPTLRSQTHMVGEAMRSYRAFKDMPGIDMLCDFHEYNTAKQAQSAKHQQGGEAMLSELYGVTGWDFDFRGHKLQGDWQAALGVTVRVPHLTWMSMKGEAKRDYPAAIGYQSPWWDRYSLIETHFARLNTALTRGKPVVKVGVVHPIESYWLHWGPGAQTAAVREQLEKNFAELTETLLFGSIDFDFICESRLPDLCPAASAPLQVGEMAYDTVIVPACHTLRGTTVERLEAFRKAGGKLVFLGECPRWVDAVASDRVKPLYEQSLRVDFKASAVLEALEGDRLIDIRRKNGARCDRILYQLRQDGEGRWLFLANGKNPVSPDVDEADPLRIRIKGEYALNLYDTMTGDIAPLSASYEGGWTVIERDWHMHDSLLLRLEPGRGSGEKAAQTEKKAVSCAPARVKITLDEPNAMLLDLAQFRLDDGAWNAEEELLRLENICRRQIGLPDRGGQVPQPYVIPQETPEHTITLRFAIDSRIAVSGAKLALEDAADTVIRLNGALVPSITDGWYVDKAIETVPLPDFPAGENTLELTVPLGRRTNLEWCYLLGDFGVTVAGRTKTITEPVRTLAFGDFTHQGLPFYTGCVTYHFPVTVKNGALTLRVPHYRGALMEVSIDGAYAGPIVFAPYTLTKTDLADGEHQVELKLIGTRQNGFAQLHHTQGIYFYQSPRSWRTEGDKWTYEYQFKKAGVLRAPDILE